MTMTMEMATTTTTPTTMTTIREPVSQVALRRQCRGMRNYQSFPHHTVHGSSPSLSYIIILRYDKERNASQLVVAVRQVLLRRCSNNNKSNGSTAGRLCFSSCLRPTRSIYCSRRDRRKSGRRPIYQEGREYALTEFMWSPTTRGCPPEATTTTTRQQQHFHSGLSSSASASSLSSRAAISVLAELRTFDHVGRSNGRHRRLTSRPS
jgi:hypothetical protein